MNATDRTISLPFIWYSQSFHESRSIPVLRFSCIGCIEMLSRRVSYGAKERGCFLLLLLGLWSFSIDISLGALANIGFVFDN